MAFTPLHDRVLVRRVESEEKTAGGLIIPDSAKEKPAEGIVVAVGAGARDEDGKRVIFDGGFTRLYCGWEEAGTGRYVRNAAAWLVNVERFGDEVVGKAKPAAQTPEPLEQTAQ